MAAQDKSMPWEDAPLSVADRRRSERKGVRAVGKITASAAEPQVHGRSVVMVDLSLHGAGFTSPVELAAGSVYGLQVSADWMQLSSRIKIASCRQREDLQWDVGAEFA